MNCSEFEIEVQSLVEARQTQLSESASLHLHDCAECRRCWEDHQLINMAIDALPPVQAPAWLIKSVVTELMGDQQPVATSRSLASPRPSKRDGLSVLVSIVAVCLILAVGLIGPMSRDRGPQFALSPAHDVPKRQATRSNTVEVATSVAAVFADLRAEYHELAAETKATARDFAAALPPTVSTVWNPGESLIPGMKPDIDPSTSVDRSTPSRTVSNIGRSFSDQISQAMDFLWIAAPDSGPRG